MLRKQVNVTEKIKINDNVISIFIANILQKAVVVKRACRANAAGGELRWPAGCLAKETRSKLHA